MESKYLNDNPLPWLLEESDPSIRYLTIRDILNDSKSDNYYDAILESIEAKRLFKGSKDKILGNTENFDIYYRGSMWYFAEAVERGMDKRTEAIDQTIEFIVNKSQMSSGGFTLNWNPKAEAACRTGDMIKYMILAGYNDERVKKGIDWIISKQRHDNGWLHCPISGVCDQIMLMLFNRSGKGLKKESDQKVKSCFFATVACSMALINYSKIDNSGRYKEPINRAVDFFLECNLFKNSKNEPIKPKGNWNRDFRLLGYPILSQYDILYGLIFLAKAGFLSDRRTGEAFNLVMSRQNDDGTWNLENAQTGMLYGESNRAPIGKKNKWVTLNAMRLLKLAEEQ